jgi:hypothetical protein
LAVIRELEQRVAGTTIALSLLSGGASAVSCADAPLLADGAECSSDGACSSDFCDLGKCTNPASPFPILAQECADYGPYFNSGPINYSGREHAKYAACHGFLCIDGKCRSCASAEQCYDAVGNPSCYQEPGWPGKRCGLKQGEEVYQPPPLTPQEGHTVDPVDQEAQMPTSLLLQGAVSMPATAGAHLAVVWWHQRAGEQDEFMRIAYDTPIDSSFTELAIPFSSLALPAEENLNCWRDCRNRSICSCTIAERFALASVLVATDRDGDGHLSLDEIRSEQMGGIPAVIGWAPEGLPGFDSNLQFIHQGFATYVTDGTRFAVVTSDAAEAQLVFCPPDDASCSFPVEHVYCNAPNCAHGRDWGLNRFGL